MPKLVYKFRNLSAKFLCELNWKITIDHYVYNELLRLSYKFEAKILKNVRNNSVYNCFGQLLAHVVQSYSFPSLENVKFSYSQIVVIF